MIGENSPWHLNIILPDTSTLDTKTGTCFLAIFFLFGGKRGEVISYDINYGSYLTVSSSIIALLV